ncbi:Protein of unknown function [Cnuella takakiae]|uniref:DUF3347 domain-containing protein n=1 Tax=Cnuella takakiae TaxID=1302690 RepID=A0A1M4V8I0_9BACT|nr:DUF3347 domain-containing protein [Cnuella takakiae]OLY92678.1 hypothetical protein BUE76_12855 [Cnuella takakiae]SHE65158.1 Protein of unknown function [Cnuella takakiae]
MKKIVLLVVLALAGVAAWYFWETKPKPDNEVAALSQPLASKHSLAFNQSVDSVLNAYYALSDALVNWDSAKAQIHTTQLKDRLAHFPLSELKGDEALQQTARPLLAQVQQGTTSMEAAAGLEAKRRAFHTLSQNLYNLLRTVRYDAATIYLQECPMAFNDDGTGNWLSQTAAIRNPYLGTQHPKYKSGMLECGETKDSIDFAHGK